ncbi:hypothetical protein J6590_005884 [Homalodisca vitripennis]|nr:hypothetical protein J6590_005884 [Homalodisca vitripennis]
MMDSRNRDKVQVILTKLKQILLKADVVSFLLYYYFEDTLDDMSEIYENCVSCKLWIWDISYFSLHIVCRQILVQVAPRWIPNIPLRLSLMKNVRGRYIELFGINFLLYGVVSYNCSVIVGYFSVYYELQKGLEPISDN